MWSSIIYGGVMLFAVGAVVSETSALNLTTTTFVLTTHGEVQQHNDMIFNVRKELDEYFPYLELPPICLHWPYAEILDLDWRNIERKLDEYFPHLQTKQRYRLRWYYAAKLDLDWRNIERNTSQSMSVSSTDLRKTVYNVYLCCEGSAYKIATDNARETSVACKNGRSPTSIDIPVNGFTCCASCVAYYTGINFSVEKVRSSNNGNELNTLPVLHRDQGNSSNEHKKTSNIQEIRKLDGNVEKVEKQTADMQIHEAEKNRHWKEKPKLPPRPRQRPARAEQTKAKADIAQFTTKSGEAGKKIRDSGRTDTADDSQATTTSTTDWKSGMGMRINDVIYSYEDHICPPTINVWREVSFQRLLAGAFLFMFYIASKMYDALNARKIKVMENEQDNCNKNCKAKQEIQNINEKCWYPETHEIKRNTFNEPCNLFAVYEQEANESDAIRAKKHTILEKEEARLMHLVMCKICLDADACVVFLPCCHMVACGVCRCFLEKCPVCRAKIVEFLQVNLN